MPLSRIRASLIEVKMKKDYLSCIRLSVHRCGVRLGVCCIVACLLLCMSCGSGRRGNAQGADHGDNAMQYAQLIRIYPADGYDDVQIIDYHDSTKVLKHLWLVPDSVDFATPVPKDVTLLRTPIKSSVVFSSVHAGVYKELGMADRVTGVVDAGYFTDPYFVAGIRNGSIIDCGVASSPTVEKILALHPDAVIYSLYDGMQATELDKLSAQGIVLVPFIDQVEHTPLARAEWIRFIGRLLGKGDQSDRAFADIARKYNDIKDEASKLKKHPTVLTDNLYEGVWYVPGGESYQATLIKDAGGKYLWDDDKSTGSLNLSFEQVLARAKDADIWLWKGYGYTLTPDKLLGFDSRYTNFKAAHAPKALYFSDTARSRLFEETPFHPELLLRDYALIFSGKANDSIRYFRPMIPA